MDKTLAAACLPLFDAPLLKIGRSLLTGGQGVRLFCDDEVQPTAAIVMMEQGLGFAAGDARHAPALLECLHGWRMFYEIIAQDEAWHAAFAAWSKKSQAVARYAMDVGPGGFDEAALRALAVPPEGTELRKIDENLLARAIQAEWSADWIGLFGDAETYAREGLGVALLKDGEIVAGCSSFLAHADGWEVQIDTHPDHRGKGYATCVGAAFILEALERGKTAHWDAANIASVRLAQRLGYRLRCAYPAWVLMEDVLPASRVIEAMCGVLGD